VTIINPHHSQPKIHGVPTYSGFRIIYRLIGTSRIAKYIDLQNAYAVRFSACFTIVSLVVTIIVSPKAVDDLEEIGDYIARVNRPVR